MRESKPNLKIDKTKNLKILKCANAHTTQTLCRSASLMNINITILISAGNIFSIAINYSQSKKGLFLEQYDGSSIKKIYTTSINETNSDYMNKCSKVI